MSSNEAAAAAALLAFGMLSKALKLAKQLSDVLASMNAYRQLAVIAYIQGKEEEALAHLNRHLTLAMTSTN